MMSWGPSCRQAPIVKYSTVRAWLVCTRSGQQVLQDKLGYKQSSVVNSLYTYWTQYELPQCTPNECQLWSGFEKGICQWSSTGRTQDKNADMAQVVVGRGDQRVDVFIKSGSRPDRPSEIQIWHKFSLPIFSNPDLLCLLGFHNESILWLGC